MSIFAHFDRARARHLQNKHKTKDQSLKKNLTMLATITFVLLTTQASAGCEVAFDPFMLCDIKDRNTSVSVGHDDQKVLTAMGLTVKFPNFSCRNRSPWRTSILGMHPPQRQAQSHFMLVNTPMRLGVGLRLNYLQMIYHLRLTLGGLKSREMAKFSKSSSVYPN